MGKLYEERLAQHVGTTSPRVEAVDEVCPQMVRHWIEVMQDANPACSDPEWAAGSRHGGIVAPGTMMQAWTLQPLWPPYELPPMPVDPVNDTLNEAGYTQVVATEQSQHYERLAKVGDRVAYTMRVLDISKAEHKTALGLAYYVTIEYRFVNQNEELLGTQRFKYMKYQAPSASRRIYQG